MTTTALPTAKKRKTRTRTKRVSSRPALKLSQLPPSHIDLRDPLKAVLVCEDCGTWCPITGMRGRDQKLVPHHTGKADVADAIRCRGSNRRIEWDLTIPEWHQLLADAIKESASRRATRVLRKPKTPPAPAVGKIVAPAPSADAARRLYEMHRKACAGCTPRSTCSTGRQLLATYAGLLQEEPQRRTVREAFARERARFDRQYAAAARESNSAMWAGAELAPRNETAKRSGTAVEEANNTRRTIRPGAVSELRGADVPLTSPTTDRRPAPAGPECACCGATETGLVRAVTAGWRLVRRQLHCGPCAGRFPAWMTTQI